MTESLWITVIKTERAAEGYLTAGTFVTQQKVTAETLTEWAEALGMQYPPEEGYILRVGQPAWNWEV